MVSGSWSGKVTLHPSHLNLKASSGLLTSLSYFWAPQNGEGRVWGHPFLDVLPHCSRVKGHLIQLSKPLPAWTCQAATSITDISPHRSEAIPWGLSPPRSSPRSKAQTSDFWIPPVYLSFLWKIRWWILGHRNLLRDPQYPFAPLITQLKRCLSHLGWENLLLHNQGLFSTYIYGINITPWIRQGCGSDCYLAPSIHSPFLF